MKLITAVTRVIKDCKSNIIGFENLPYGTKHPVSLPDKTVEKAKTETGFKKRKKYININNKNNNNRVQVRKQAYLKYNIFSSLCQAAVSCVKTIKFIRHSFSRNFANLSCLRVFVSFL